MTFAGIPWLEVAMLAAAAGWVGLASRTPGPWAVGACTLALVASLGEWLCHYAGWVQAPGARLAAWLAVDGLSAPLLPMTALLHLVTALSTPRAEATAGYYPRLLLSLVIQLATFGCTASWLLIGLLAAGTLPPTLELLSQGRGYRPFLGHLCLYGGLLGAGWSAVEAGHTALGGTLLLVAVLIRAGTVPFHTWVSSLFEGGRFGTALLFVVPLVGVYAAVRLVVPTAPGWVLRGLGALSVATALYAAGLGVVQRDGRRLFVSLLVSHTGLVLIGMELLTPVSLCGSLSLWLSSSLSLCGLGLVLRAVEARFGRLTLDGYRGLYGQSPALASCFLLMGMAAVGFPGTLGFISAEMLVDGAVTENLFVGLAVVFTGLLNGVALMRAYFLLFTGARHESSVPLGITARERAALLPLVLLILGGGMYPQPGIATRTRAAQKVLAQRAANGLGAGEARVPGGHHIDH